MFDVEIIIRKLLRRQSAALEDLYTLVPFGSFISALKSKHTFSVEISIRRLLRGQTHINNNTYKYNTHTNNVEYFYIYIYIHTERERGQ